MNILALGASTSSTSINQELATHAASLIPNATITNLKLNTLNLPIYSEDEEQQNGHPADAQKFLDVVAENDAVIISLAEHNGSYTAAFKNIYDWASRINYNVWQNKPMLLLSTSPGQGGAANVLAAGAATFPRMGATITATFSLPSFHDNFSKNNITDSTLKAHLHEAITAFKQSI